MSWLFSRALVAEYLPVSSSESEPSVQLSVMPTQQMFSHNDKMMAPSNLSRFGLTCEVLTASRGEELLRLSLVASRVLTSALQEKARESKESKADSGQKWQGLLAKYDLDMCLWRTCQLSLLEDLEQSFLIWPKCGMTRSGVAYQQPKLEPITEESAFGFYVPTPTASDGTSGSVIGKDDTYYTTKTGMPRKITRHGVDGSVGLGRLVNMWPTPTTDSATERTKKYSQGGMPLTLAVREREKWPTPTTSDAYNACMKLTENGIPHDVEKGNLRGAIKIKFPTPVATAASAGTPAGRQQRMLGNCKEVRGETKEEWEKGSLNADWTEWLMGFPVGWSDLKATPSEALSWDREPEGLPRVCKKQEYRALRLKGIGNAQVPQCAAAAFIQLMERIENE